MAISSVAELVHALRDSAILDRKHAEELAREVPGRYPDARALARALVRRNWVTPYQINQLFLGRGPDLTLGPYVLLERLGEGGMGMVFKARHQKLNRLVALKVIRRDKLNNTEAIRRFYREIQAAGALHHPNVVAAYDADEVQGTYYFAMEYVEGPDLGRLVKENGPLDVSRACEYVRQAALGLQHAYEKGLVHRDIKPSNLMLQTGGSQAEAEPLVKVLDMGLARPNELLGDEATLTQAHAVLGTPDFIAPEQAVSAHSADIRSDLYSLGCTFYFLLTGEVPFQAEAPMEKLLKHHLEEPPRVEALRPEVPAPVSRVIRKLMAKDPGLRYQTPAELAAVLGSVLAGSVPVGIPVGAAVPGKPAAPTEDEEALVEDTVPDVNLAFETSDTIVQVRSRVGRRRPRRGLFAYAVAGVLLGLTAIVVIILLRLALS